MQRAYIATPTEKQAFKIMYQLKIHNNNSKKVIKFLTNNKLKSK